MENIVPKISSNLSKMWTKVLNLENSLFLELKESLRIEEFSRKESKLVNILDFAEIEKFVITTSLTKPPQDREQMARAFVAKSVYNFQTTRDLIEHFAYYVDGDIKMIFQVNQLLVEPLKNLVN